MTNALTAAAALHNLRTLTLDVRHAVRTQGPGAADHLGSQLRAARTAALAAGNSEAAVTRTMFR